MAEFLRAARRLFAAADGAVCDDAFHRRAVRIPQMALNELLGGNRHSHRLLLKTFPDAAPASVDDRADTDTHMFCFHGMTSFLF